MVGFYNGIYTKEPKKWANIERDYVAFRLLSAWVKEPYNMLDIGCGNGHTIAFFHSQWYDTKFTGVDISDVALKLAKERVYEAEFTRKIPAEGQWDVITVMGVAEHFKDPAAELKRIGKLLAPRGVLYLEVPNCLAYSEDKTEGFRKTSNGAGQNEWHWERATWEKAIKDAGLVILKGYNGTTAEWEFVWVLRRE